MPKLGRRLDFESVDEWDHMWTPRDVTRNAPFGTDTTPTLRVKIVGSRRVSQYDSKLGTVNTSITSSPPPPVQNAPLGFSPRRGPYVPDPSPRLGPMTEKPTEMDAFQLAKMFKAKNRLGYHGYDAHNSNVHSQNTPANEHSKSDFSPHPVIPPIQQTSAPEPEPQPQSLQDPYQSPRTRNISSMYRERLLREQQQLQQQEYLQQQQQQQQMMDSNLQGNSYTYVAPNSSRKTNIPPQRVDLSRLLPRDQYLPVVPVHLNSDEEFELRRQLREELLKFNLAKLKDIYMELTGFDSHLTGYVQYTTLETVLARYRAEVSPTVLRLVASQYVSSMEIGKVNYEKVLAYLSSTMRGLGPSQLTENKESNLERKLKMYQEKQQQQQQQQDSYREQLQQYQQQQQQLKQQQPFNMNTGEPSDQVDQAPPATSMSSPRADLYYNPVTHETEDYRKKSPQPKQPESMGSKKFPYGDRDNAKLLRMIEDQVLNAGEGLDFEKIWAQFRLADRECRGRLSREQIKAISKYCRIPLQESIQDQIINKCDGSYGQYSWEQYLEFIERVQPLHTGLHIPDSKKPVEYVKHYPEPTNNWPNNSTLPPAARKAASISGDTISYRNNYYQSPRQQKLEPLAPKTAEVSPRDQRKQKLINDLENEIQKLENTYKVTKQKLLKEQQDTPKDSQLWFDRFLTLANALYKNDVGNTGSLPYQETRWLTHKYNEVYSLGIPEGELDKALMQCSDKDGCVAIDPMLKLLGMNKK